MKRTVLSLVIAIFAGSIWAQPAVTDSTVMGPGYANEVYYSLLNGKVSEAPIKNWDIAINTTRFDVIILANHANGVTVYNYTKGDTSAWNSLDTTGITHFSRLYNSDTTWTLGAFNQTPNGQPLDFSWGVYDPGTHKTTGDSLYILKLESQGNPVVFKKFHIRYRDANGNTCVRYANLDGSSDTTVIITPDNASLYYFTYFSLRDNAKVSREPGKNSWDLTFTRWWDTRLDYPVTGVLSNRSVLVAEARGTAPGLAAYDDFKALETDNISAIGWDWKATNASFQYETVDSLCYFVRALDNKLWKLRFTYFSGSSRGTTVFEKTLISDPASISQGLSLPVLEVYPNPASGQVQVIFESPAAGQPVDIFIRDVTGKQVCRSHPAQAAQLQVQTLDIQSLQPGVYFVTLQSPSGQATRKLIIQ